MDNRPLISSGRLSGVEKHRKQLKCAAQSNRIAYKCRAMHHNKWMYHLSLFYLLHI
jgi:hypothetical protein